MHVNTACLWFQDVFNACCFVRQNALDSFPELSVVTELKTDCETPVFKVRLSGRAYNRKSMKPSRSPSKLPLVRTAGPAVQVLLIPNILISARYIFWPLGGIPYWLLGHCTVEVFVSFFPLNQEYTVDQQKSKWFSLYHSLQHYKYHTYLMCMEEVRH